MNIPERHAPAQPWSGIGQSGPEAGVIMARILFKDRGAPGTGGTNGIGKVICLHLAEHGCGIACGDGRDVKAAEASEEESRARGYQGTGGLYM